MLCVFKRSIPGNDSTKYRKAPATYKIVWCGGITKTIQAHLWAYILDIIAGADSFFDERTSPNPLNGKLLCSTMTETYEYDIIRVRKKGTLKVRFEEDYREIIKQKAREGWRVVQLFAPPIEGYGVVQFVDLIFERKSVY